MWAGVESGRELQSVNLIYSYTPSHSNAFYSMIEIILLQTKSPSTYTSHTRPTDIGLYIESNIYILDNTSPAVLPLVHCNDPVGHLPHNMGILNIPPELSLLVADNLSLGALFSFRSTCYGVRDVLNPRFEKICLQDVGKLTALQWAAVRGHAKLIELAISNGAGIDAPLRGKLSMVTVKDPDWAYGPGISCANRSTETEAKNCILRTLLFLAACFGHVEAIEVLLKLGASMQCFGEMPTPVHTSARRGDVYACRRSPCWVRHKRQRDRR